MKSRAACATIVRSSNLFTLCVIRSGPRHSKLEQSGRPPPFATRVNWANRHGWVRIHLVIQRLDVHRDVERVIGDGNALMLPCTARYGGKRRTGAATPGPFDLAERRASPTGEP